MNLFSLTLLNDDSGWTIMSNVPTTRPGVQERIFLHLRDYVDHSGKVEVPFALSQMGIANSVAIARSNVPRAISGMREQGLLIERQAHVTGVSRKRKAYFLTDDGIKVANGIWEKVSTQNVSCLLYTSPSPRDLSTSRMPSSA